MVDNRDKVYEIEQELRDYVHAFSLRSAENSDNSMFKHILRNEDFNEIRAIAKVDHNFQIRSHRKILGPIIVFMKKAVRRLLRWYIDTLVHHQNRINEQIINLFENQFRSMLREMGKINATQARLEIEFREYTNDFQIKLSHLTREFEQQTKVLSNFGNEYTKSITDSIGKITEELRFIQAQVRRLRTSSSESYVDSNLNSLCCSTEIQSPQKSNTSFDYYLFEEKFRGSWELIRKRQEKYVNYFKPGESVLDIGCGRGEFVSLMVEHGVRVIGIDKNKDMLSVAIEKGLPVQHADAQVYLTQVADASLDGIFMSHVVEHIPTEQLLDLLEICYKKLRYSGRIIMETPNPLSLLIFSNSFYLDPTHQKPVHPETLKFMLSQVGFEIVETIFSGEIDDEEKLLFLQVDNKLDGLDDLFERLNHNIEKLNRWLYGPQDYSVLAVRK
jgi:2-polyprenyl-3-methyl-5-hydroxy-6-metoxy-1,4-benzoquinol methylase